MTLPIGTRVKHLLGFPGDDQRSYPPGIEGRVVSHGSLRYLGIEFTLDGITVAFFFLPEEVEVIPEKGDSSLLLQDGKALVTYLVKLSLEAYDGADPGHDSWERDLFEKVARERMSQVAQVLVMDFEFALERAQHRPYRRGLSRLVGNARCNECRTHKPALTAFGTGDPPDGSCDWMVCDDCLRAVLPPVS